MVRPLGVLCLLVAACDPSIRPEAGAAPPPGRVGREHESCAATRDCLEPLRCVEGACVRGTTSRLGEYFWTMGRRASERSSPAAAVVAFQQAAAQFETDRLPVPAELLCEHGVLLRKKVSGPHAAEQAARLLHRCVLMTPPGSALHQLALRELLELEPRGLDPTLLSRDTLADSYLVNPPTPPPPEALEIQVARTTPHADRGYEAWARLLEGPAARAPLAACFGAAWVKSFEPRMVVVLPARMRARADGSGATLELLVTGGDEAGRCVRAALAPLASDVGASGSWSGSVTLTVSLQ